MKRIAVILSLIVTGLFSHAQDSIRVSADLVIVPISSNAYIHTSYFYKAGIGRFPSNGLIYVAGKKVMLVDTPMSDSTTQRLIDWIEKEKGWNITSFVANHWHDDCTAGLDLINAKKIDAFSSKLTKEALDRKGLPTTKRVFSEFYELDHGGKEVYLEYPGPGHTIDNIVIWIPEDSILFAGCMSKSADAKSLGNIEDAVLEKWSGTLDTVLLHFGQAKTVVPGHGAYGGLDLIHHTKELLELHRIKQQVKQLKFSAGNDLAASREASDLLDKALTLDPANIKLHLQKGDLLAEKGRSILNEELPMDYVLAEKRQEEAAQNFRLALRHYSDAEAIQPANLEVLNRLKEMYKALGKASKYDLVTDKIRNIEEASQ